jgi:hypothetical protein
MTSTKLQINLKFQNPMTKNPRNKDCSQFGFSNNNFFFKFMHSKSNMSLAGNESINPGVRF